MTGGTLLTEMRTARRLSQAQLARRSGIPRTAINAYEGGHRVPTTATLLRLAEACGMRLQPAPRVEVDTEANDMALQQALDLAELLPTRRRAGLAFPGLPR